MKPVAALVAITLILLVGPLTGVAPAGEPADRVVPPDGGPLRLELAQVGPRLVTAGGPDTLTVVGTLTNTGDRPVDDLVVRVQRGDPLDAEGRLRDALDGAAGTDAVTPQFTPLPGELPPGGQLPVRLDVPLRGAPETTLALRETGVYELLVNVNGVPQDGARARLAAVRMLLPVLSLPAAPGVPAGDPDDAGADRPGATPFSLLYPITDVPRRLSTVPGEPTLLTDDDLAGSLAPDGRLGGLVTALADAAPAGSAVRQSICLAIDPDLVETAAAMRAGYSVLAPDGSLRPGGGAEVAGAWLDGLSAVAGSGCVIALPYADADLVALTRGGLGDLATGAVTEGRRTLAELLGVAALAEATWPADGLLDGPTLDRVGAAGGRTLVLAADGVGQGRTQRSTGVVPIEGAPGGQTAVLTDPLLTAAATGPADRDAAVNPRGGAAAVSSPAGGTGPLATQDGIGALVFRVQGGDTTDGGPLVLAPPHDWAVGGASARVLLDAVGQLINAGLLRPRGEEAVTAPAATGDALPLAYPLDAAGQEVPGQVVDTIGATAAAVADLRSAAKPGSPVGVSPDEAFAPLERGLVRPASAVLRGREAAATAAARTGEQRIDDLRGTVRVLEPPTPYSLGTQDAPIPITVANGLPVTMEVRVEIAPSPGLRVAPIEPQQIPPLGRRQVNVSAEVTRAGQFTVQASVRTPAGELLGPPSRLRIRSTAYGTITLWLTGSAGILLVVLAARRVVRRIRGEQPERREIALGPRPAPPPADPTAPSPPTPASPSTPAAPPSAGTQATQPVRPVRPPVDPAAVTRPVPVPPTGSPSGPPAPPAGSRPGTDRRTGDPFPDPAAPTERLPAAHPRPRPRPPEPPRVGSR